MRTGYVPHVFLLWPLIFFNGVSAVFHLNTTYIGRDFLSGWNWETLDDPTHGRVNYVDQGTALSSNLSYATDSKFVMRADDFSVVPPSARGRNSVRITSQLAFDESLIILDLEHMPEGCSTWPAFWTLSARGPWPQGGEIDIVEGVNQQTQNLASLHTTPNCNMAQQRPQSGQTTSTTCDASVNYNTGCGVSFSKPSSFGVPFNRQNGGYFVVARSAADGVRVWFWQRGDPNTPPEVLGNSGVLVGKRDVLGLGPLRKHGKGKKQTLFGQVLEVGGADTIDPNESWGYPEAYFPTADNCGYQSHFDAHQMVFDLTFCGDWAGSAWPTAGCGAGSCVDYVNNNPKAFSNAYWEVNSIRVYTPS